MKNNNLKVLLEEMLDLIYPQNITCILCNNPIDKNNTYSMCRECFNQLNFIQDGCLKCGKVVTNYSLEDYKINECSYCKNKTFYFDKSISCIEYTDFSKDIIFKLKYKDKTYMSRYIAEIMKEKIELENIKCDYLLSVPLHKSRIKERGFNQSQKISKYLSELTKIPYIEVVERVYNTKKLYKLKRDDRSKELKNAFIINNKDILKNKDIIIIDDIFTTGLTLNEISKLLKINEVNKITTLTFLAKSN